MSVLSLLNSLILRSTSNPPLTNKGSAVSASEEDGNWVKVFNAIQDIVSGENVEAYDAGATYDYYSTDVYEKYCGYDNKIWKAVYVGSPSTFSGQTPAEGAYWTQVTLAQLLRNIMSLVELAHETNARRRICPQYCTPWQSFTNQDLNSSPVDIVGLEAPGAGKIIVPKFYIFALDAGGTAYDFPVMSSIFLAYSTTPTVQASASISHSEINSATDLIINNAAQPSDGTVLVVNDKMQLTATADATQGNGTYYIKVIYQIEDAPF